jgi:hypothetical protein
LQDGQNDESQSAHNEHKADDKVTKGEYFAEQFHKCPALPYIQSVATNPGAKVTNTSEFEANPFWTWGL